MKKPGPLLLVLAIALVAGLGVWLANFSTPVAEGEPEPVEEELAHGSDEPAPRALEEGVDDEPVTELDDPEEEHAERAEVAVAQVEGAPAPTGPMASVRGRVTDAATGDALPRFLVRIHDKTHREDVLTDADGRFESATRFLAGRIRIDPLDHAARRRPAATQEFEHELEGDVGNELELVVPSGPTFFLAFEPQGDVLALTPPTAEVPTKSVAKPGSAPATGATERAASGPASNADGAQSSSTSVPQNGGAAASTGTPASTATPVRTAAPSNTATPTDASADPQHRLRLEDARLWLAVAGEEVRDRVGSEPVRAPSAGDALALPWVRFGPVDPAFDRAERIELRSADGVWRADTPVKALRGVQAAPVTLKLEARAALTGRVLDADGRAIARAQVVLREDAENPRERRREATTDAEGRYRFEYLRPVAYRATARSLRHTPEEKPVTLVAREVAQLDFALVPLPPAGPIRGEITTETGRSTPRARITLSSGRGGPSLVSDVNWTTHEGRKVGRFEFSALPAGPFTLTVEKDDWLKWEPRQLEVTAPKEDVRILVRDDMALCDYVVRARDRDNGLQLDGPRVWIEFQNGPSRERRATWNEPIERGVPVERPFRWRIDHPGYGSERGNEQSFALEEHRDGRITRVLELPMTAGWSDVVRTVRRDGKGAIEGVEIVVDGRSMGRTSKDGTLKLELRDPPKSLEAKHPNWRLAAAPDLRPAWKRDERKFLLLRFNPAPRRKQ